MLLAGRYVGVCVRVLRLICPILGVTSLVSGAEKASASLTFSQLNSNTYHYSLTFNDIGTTNLGTFWFAWIPGQDYMPTVPTNISSPASWTAAIVHSGQGDGYAILFQANSAAAAVTPGNSLTGFAFDSATTPQQMAGPSMFYNNPPVLTSFAYTGMAFSDSGYEFVVTLPLRFVPIVPCRAVDTRRATGAFGGPQLAANGTRAFSIQGSACSIPSNALAYSTNVTVVPDGSLGFLTIWPFGQAQPVVSTLNSDGRTKANAAIVPAGNDAGGSLNVFVTDATQFILDIDGYFVQPGPNALEFYNITPCRVADTRNANGPLGGPFISANASRSFPVATACNIPSGALAYSLNFTAVPHGPLGFVTAWPEGKAQPNASVLNATTGAITANAALISAGTPNGGVSVFASNDTDIVIDINGYFGPPSDGLSLYTVTPCRVLDTRNTTGAFNGTRVVAVETSACQVNAAAQSYVLNATVVPPSPLLFLSLWADGQSKPLVSTLNANDAAITSNMALVPTTNGNVDAFSSSSTQLILDISAYFAP